MKAICSKNNLKEVVYLCEKIAGKNLTLPILNNILIEGNDRSLKFTATNLEIGLEIIIPAKVEKDGKITVPASVISSFISNLLGEDNVILESQNNNLFNIFVSNGFDTPESVSMMNKFLDCITVDFKGSGM